MKLPKVQTLLKVSLGVTVAGIGSMIYMQLKQLENISESVYFKETFKILRAHKGAVQLMGEPIKQLGFRVDNPKNYIASDHAQFYVNVKGPNDKGRVFLWAEPNNDTWRVTRIELELKKHPGKRLLIKDGPTNNNNTEATQ